MSSARLGKGLLASIGTCCLVATQACLRQSTSSRFKWNGTLVVYFPSSLFPFFLLPFFIDLLTLVKHGFKHLLPTWCLIRRRSCSAEPGFSHSCSC